MTRTRTQTALTKLAELVANVHGELETVERLLADVRSQAQVRQDMAQGPGRQRLAPLQESSAMRRHETRAMARAAARAEEAELQAGALDRRRRVLLAQRDSLYATVRQFDVGLDPCSIGLTRDWLKQYGRGGGKTATARYLRSLEATSSRF
jgi:hypothetical protein